MPKLGQIHSRLTGRSLFLGKHYEYHLSACELLGLSMGTNLPTILPMLRFWIIVLTCVLSNITAQAHPGHEGGHDGDEFVWTADHLTSHPGATLMALAAAALIAWGAYRFLSASQRQLKAAAARSQAEGKSV